MRGRRYGGDPHDIEVRFSGSTCAGCGVVLARGSRAFYYPLGRELYGEACGCAAPHRRDFESAAADEAMCGGGW
jgi:hypothetical protein